MAPPMGVSVGAVVVADFALVLSPEDLEAVLRAPEQFPVLRPSPPVR